MQGSQRLLFFLLVLFFAGSMVILGAQQLKQELLGKNGRVDREAARRLIQDLQGEVFAKQGEAPDQKRLVDPEVVPSRENGGVLPAADRQRLITVIKSLIPSDQPADKSSAEK